MFKKGLLILSAFIVFFSISRGQDIFQAVQKGDIQKIKEMIEKQPSLAEAKDEDDSDLLAYAIYFKQREALKYLLEKVPNKNVKNVVGMTPLFVACSRCDLESIKLLIDNGADVNIGHIEHGLPLDMASTFCNDNLVQYLKDKGARYTEVILEKVQLSKNIYKIAFNYGHRTNIVVSSGSDGLMMVDGGFSRQAIPEIKKILNEIQKTEIKYMINTHLHWDHTIANIMIEDTNRILSYKNISQRSNALGIKKIEKPMIGKTGKSYPYYYLMNFNGEEVRLIPYPDLHTDADWLIYFTKSGVVHMGDLLIAQSYPSLRKNTTGYIEFLEKTIDIFPDNTIFVCGHGADVDKAGLVKYCDLLKTTKEIVQKALKDGKKTEDIIKEKLLDRYEFFHKIIAQLGPAYWINAVSKD